MTACFDFPQLIRLFCFAAVVLFTVPVNLMADEPVPAKQIAGQLQDFYQGLSSISFNFSQISRTGGRERPGKGNAVFIKEVTPEKTRSIMRWNYTEPDKQIIISDGRTLTIYTDKDKQLIKTSARDLESDITYAFFAGTRNLLDDFAIRQATNSYVFSNSDDLQALMLEPLKPHNQIKEVVIWLDDSKIIHHMRIVDHFDAVTELTFENITINSIQTTDKQTIESITTFPVPPGTEIITQ